MVLCLFVQKHIEQNAFFERGHRHYTLFCNLHFYFLHNKSVSSSCGWKCIHIYSSSGHSSSLLEFQRMKLSPHLRLEIQVHRIKSNSREMYILQLLTTKTDRHSVQSVQLWNKHVPSSSETVSVRSHTRKFLICLLLGIC